MSENPHQEAVARKLAEKHRQQEQQQEQQAATAQRRREKQSAKVTRLYEGLAKIEKRHEVTLPMMSAALGEPFTLQLRDVTQRELFASNMFPPTAARLIDQLYRDSEEVTRLAREQVNMMDILQDVAEQKFENPMHATIIALHEIEDVFACMAVSDPEVQLVMHEWEQGGNKIWVRRFRREDITAIADAVWHNVEVEAGEALPFPVSRHADNAVPQGEAVRVSSERADDV